jgi:uncharacterized membrane protein
MSRPHYILAFHNAQALLAAIASIHVSIPSPSRKRSMRIGSLLRRFASLDDITVVTVEFSGSTAY